MNIRRRRHAHHHLGRNGRNGWAILLLLDLGGRIMNMPNKPPVTLGIMLGCISIHFVPFIVNYVDLNNVCLMPARILFDVRWGRLLGVAVSMLGAPFVHVSDLHLAYNMGVLLLRGSKMEQSEGSRLFAILVAQVLILSQILTVIVSVFMAKLADMEELNHDCVVGFSGVLFALKYIQSQRSPDEMERILSFQVPNRYVTWVELLIIHLVVPNSSLLGHLCGIFAGILYEHWQFLRETLSNILSGAFPTTVLPVPPSYTYASCRAGDRHVSSSVGSAHSFPSYDSDDTADDAVFAAEEERMVQEALRLSLLDIGEAPPPDVESPTDMHASVGSGDSDSWVDVSVAFQGEEEKKEGGIPRSQQHDCPSELRQRRTMHFVNG